MAQLDDLKGQRKDLPRLFRGLTVTIRYGDQERVCILANSSPKGAMLRVNPDFPLPPKFQLVIEEHAIPVALKWRDGDTAGVRIDAEATASRS